VGYYLHQLLFDLFRFIQNEGLLITGRSFPPYLKIRLSGLNCLPSPTTLQKNWPQKLKITDGNMGEMVELPRP